MLIPEKVQRPPDPRLSWSQRASNPRPSACNLYHRHGREACKATSDYTVTRSAPFASVPIRSLFTACNRGIGKPIREHTGLNPRSPATWNTNRRPEPHSAATISASYAQRTWSVARRNQRIRPPQGQIISKILNVPLKQMGRATPPRLSVESSRCEPTSNAIRPDARLGGHHTTPPRHRHALQSSRRPRRQPPRRVRAAPPCR